MHTFISLVKAIFIDSFRLFLYSNICLYSIFLSVLVNTSDVNDAKS